MEETGNTGLVRSSSSGCSEESSSNSGKMMKTLIPFLTEDICLEIFFYCTLDCIFRFKCISKVCNSHLSNPSFIYNWIHNYSAGSPWNLVYNYELECSIAYLDSHSHTHLINSLSKLSLGFLNPNNEKLSFLCSSNGLVLCSKKIKKERSYYVCNPVTQKWVLLPTPPFAMHGSVTCFTCEVFQLSTTYKVVRLLPVGRKNCRSQHLQVFCSDVGSWNTYRIASKHLSWRLTLDSNNRVVMHGEMFYWMEDRERIVAFNKTDVSQLNLPDNSYDVCNLVRCLGESEGLVLYGRIKRIKKTLSVWEIKEKNFHLLHKNIGLGLLLGEMNVKSDGMLVENNWEDVIQVFSFSPVDKNVILIGCKNYIWMFNVRTEVYEELCKPTHSGLRRPFVLKAMPTIIPPCSW